MADAESGTLETMRANPAWDAESYADAVETLSEDGLVFRIWGGDWCSDCRNQLPDFGAALDAAEVSEDNIHHYPVEKEDDGSKTGPLVEEYGIELIPTVVVERDTGSSETPRADGEAVDGEEVARFVEEEPVSVAVYLADELRR